VLTIVHLITGLEMGGAEGMLARLVAYADRARFRPVVVSMTGPGTFGAQIAAAGVPLFSLGMARGVPDPRGLLRLRRVLRDFRPDLLQTWLYHADLLGLVAWRLGWVPRLVWNVRSTETIGAGRARALLARWSALPDAVVVNAKEGQRFHEALGYRPRRWVHIPNGFDTEALRPDPAARQRQRAALGVADGAFLILLPARYHPMKDHATFLDAAARLAASSPQVRFALAGEGTGPGNAVLMAAIAEHRLGDRVVLLGDRRDLPAVYQAVDLVTLSSAYGEGFPNVLAEAMSCGIPCVATDVGDSREIVGEAGEIVPPCDPTALAAAWGKFVVLGAEERGQRGAFARERIVENYGLLRIVSCYAEFHESVAAGRFAPSLAAGDGGDHKS
jgi:glycosyltransferase involved in cell wall biosynthesis